MTRSILPACDIHKSAMKLMTTVSFASLSLALSFNSSAVAQEQPFGTMVGMQNGTVTLPNGQLSQWTGANAPMIGLDEDGRPLMTIEQTESKALLDWEDFRLQTNEVLEFQQQSENWIAVNRVHGNQAAEIHGELRAPGKVFIFNDNGVLIGEDAIISTRTLVTGQGVSDVNIDGNVTTITQSQERAILNWSDMSTQAGELMKFDQERTDWIALNRSLSENPTRLAGDIEADGHVYLVAPEGLGIAGDVTAQQVIASQLDIVDEQFLEGFSKVIELGGVSAHFSNSWQREPDPRRSSDIPISEYLETLEGGPRRLDPNDPLRDQLRIESGATITTGNKGAIVLIGNAVTNEGTLSIQDEGQVVLAAGEHVWLTPEEDDQSNERFEAVSGFWNSVRFGENGAQRIYDQFVVIDSAAELEVIEGATGLDYEMGDTISYNEWYGYGGFEPLFAAVGKYLEARADAVAIQNDHVARNTGSILSSGGGRVDFRGMQLEQLGVIDLQSTANFRAGVDMEARLYSYLQNREDNEDGPTLGNNGTVIFGENSLTQITPDPDAIDTIALSEGAQSIGSLEINAFRVHMEDNSIIHMPSGRVSIWLDEGSKFKGISSQAGGVDNESGTRFMMEDGALIDLSGWDQTVLPMSYHVVKGRAYAAQLANSPLQRDGVLYRQEIAVDRRYGTDIVDWESFDNLTQGTLEQFLTNGGTFALNGDNDFIMKSGSVIDVSGGVTTYEDGYVTTTHLRRLDGTLIDIREADPDELYMGLANEWVTYDLKWGQQTKYNVPLVSSIQRLYESSYQEGGDAGVIDILSPDAILQGTMRGEVVVGRYQRLNMPEMGQFLIGTAGEGDKEFNANNILIEAMDRLVEANFGLTDNLEDQFGGLFGVEFDEALNETGENAESGTVTSDNTLLISGDFFSRSSMGSYTIGQSTVTLDAEGARVPYSIIVEDGVDIDLSGGASLNLFADNTGGIYFGGDVRTEGGDISITGGSLVFADDVVLDTSAGWYNEYESRDALTLGLQKPRPLRYDIRIDAGDITLGQNLFSRSREDSALVLPETMVLKLAGGGWANRDGEVVGGRGGTLSVNAYTNNNVDLSAIYNAEILGLGGNGGFALASPLTFYIGDGPGEFPALPVTEDMAMGEDDPIDMPIEVEEPETEDYILISPDLFSENGYSSVAITGDRIMVTDGTIINAATKTLGLRPASLDGGLAPWILADTGADISQLIEVTDIPLGFRAEGLSRGVDITFSTQGDLDTISEASGTIVMGEGSLVRTDVGGSISVLGSGMNPIHILGTLEANGGRIDIIGSEGAAPTQAGTVILGENAVLRSQGAAVITERNTSPQGESWQDGYVADGGEITLAANQVTFEDGALLDVRGGQGQFDIRPESGETNTRVRKTFSSNGGRVEISAQVLDIGGGSYLAQAGGEDARGGTFALNYLSSYTGAPEGLDPSRYEALVTRMELYDRVGLYRNSSFQSVPLYGTDLSELALVVSTPVNIQESLVFADRSELIAYLQTLDVPAAGPPPILVIGDPEVDLGLDAFGAGGGIGDPGFIEMLAGIRFRYELLPAYDGPERVAYLSIDAINAGGFANLDLDIAPAVVFAGDVSLGGMTDSGTYAFDTVSITSPNLMAADGANVSLDAQVLNFATLTDASFNQNAFDIAMAQANVGTPGSEAVFTAKSGTITDIVDANFRGFDTVNLSSDGDIRLRGYEITPFQSNNGLDTQLYGALKTSGDLNLKADQVYAATGREFTVQAGGDLTIFAQDEGQALNGTPLEAAARLILEAENITQGGIVRSPLGEIVLRATGEDGTVTFLDGSITSASSDGNVVPYGELNNGDTWIDPTAQGALAEERELRVLPERRVSISGDNIDLQDGALVDLSGGGDLIASEFTPGFGGTVNWLTGYYDKSYEWVEAPGEIYAIIPDFEGNVAPLGLTDAGPQVGERIYLSGGSGLPEGYYTLLPAEFALLPGAYRVTAQHHYDGDYSGVSLGTSASLLDGSSLQAGYRFVGDERLRDPRTTAFLVMPRETLFLRSSYNLQQATSFFQSSEFLEKTLRRNQPLPEAPRSPLDGGSIVLAATQSMILNGDLDMRAVEGGRGGLADIQADSILVAGAETDLSAYDGYLVLQSEQLSEFGASSLLFGGYRQQGDLNLELTVGASDIVVDNAGSSLTGEEFLFASRGAVTVKADSTIETTGESSGNASDLQVIPVAERLVDDKGTEDVADDEPIHGVIDYGSVLRVSANGQIDVLRDGLGVENYAALSANPLQLEQVNQVRASFGLPPLRTDDLTGLINIETGASLTASGSLLLDATRNSIIDAGAVVSAPQIGAAASRVSIGAVPGDVEGLVFSGGSLGQLADAQDIALRSYGAIDFYGGITLAASDSLSLDASELRILEGDGETVRVTASTLTLTNTSGGSGEATQGDAALRLEADNIYLAGADKWVSGVDTVQMIAGERVVGRDFGGLFVPGALSIDAASITAESGGSVTFDAQGDVRLLANGTVLDPLATFGATLNVLGASLTSEAQFALTGGAVNLRARSGDLVLTGGEIDVTSAEVEIFDRLIGVGGGSVSLISDTADIVVGEGVTVDVSGAGAAGDAGRISLDAGLGQILLNGSLIGNAPEGGRSGTVEFIGQELTGIGELNQALDAGGFLEARRFVSRQGDITLDGTVTARNVSVVTNDGDITVTGTVETVGEGRGEIQLAASDNLNLTSTGRLYARTGAQGGAVLLETRGANNGQIILASGSVIDVGGGAEDGGIVRLRAPQVGGNDVAIGAVDAEIVGAQSVLAEAFRSYDNVSVIDDAVITAVIADADAFMVNSPANTARFGGIEITPGIELRNDGDMELVSDWDLSSTRYNGLPGVLTLRAAGDLLVNANLSDGFDGTTPDAALLSGPSWSLNLVGGADLSSPNSLAVLPVGLLDQDRGSVIIGGTPDTIEYYLRADTGASRLYLLGEDGRFLNSLPTGLGASTQAYNPAYFFELDRDVDGDYLHPVTGDKILIDPATGDYVDTALFARRPLPWVALDSSLSNIPNQDLSSIGTLLISSRDPQNYLSAVVGYLQWDNSTGYSVRTGTGDINVASGRDFVLQEKPSVLYTAGETADPIDGFIPAISGYTPTNGGDITIRVAGDVHGSASWQLPSAWLRQAGVVRDGAFLEDDGFSGGLPGTFHQTNWFIDFGQYQAGVGALGGGNVIVDADGDILDLTVNIPTTGRVAGGRTPEEPTSFHQTGGGDLIVNAGGDIRAGVFYVGDGEGKISAGGSIIGREDAVARIDTFARSADTQGCLTGNAVSPCYVHADPSEFSRYQDLYTIFYTSGGQLDVRAGGDINVDAVLDPLAPEYFEDADVLLSYTDDASVSFFSAGGDIKLWNNSLNIAALRELGAVMERATYFESVQGESSINFETGLDVELWPATVLATAAAGDIYSYGGLFLAPSPTGNLELIARDNVQIGLFAEPGLSLNALERQRANYLSATDGIFMSQALAEFVPSPDNPRASGGRLNSVGLRWAGGLPQLFSAEIPPILHLGDSDPARFYAGRGDVIFSDIVTLPKELEVRAGRHIYFPQLRIQHNNPDDLSLFKSGGGVYFDPDSFVDLQGDGRLEFEVGTDFWMPAYRFSNLGGTSPVRATQYATWNERFGIVTRRPVIGGYSITPAEEWQPNSDVADISIMVGLEQEPNYEGFADWLFNPEAVDTPDYALVDAGNGQRLSMYLFDRLNPRADRGVDPVLIESAELAQGFVNYVREQQGLNPLATEAAQQAYLDEAWGYWLTIPEGQATPYDSLLPRGEAALGARPEFYLPEKSEGLVNYVRRMSGLAPLATQDEQLAYLDEAWALWNEMDVKNKTPFFRDTLYHELRTTGREGNDPGSERYTTTFRGYDAIAKLFPGAQLASDEELGDGEVRWDGDFQAYAGRVLSRGGDGNIEIMVPGGQLVLANIAATPGQTGQNVATDSGVITESGGAISLFTHDSISLNASRVMTAKGGNILGWSSWGDIAAGRGAKTSISPPGYAYDYNAWFDLERVSAGLPTGAGISTLATVSGAPTADVDLIAPAGVIDAGDAGITVSGNFNVFAVEILGADNIDVSGVSTGLPTPPTAPPTSLDIDTNDKNEVVNKVLDDAINLVQQDRLVTSPSLIDVQIVDDPCASGGAGDQACLSDAPAESGDGLQDTAPVADEAASPVASIDDPLPEIAFNMPAQPLERAVRQVGDQAKITVLYDAEALDGIYTRAFSGVMAPDQALLQMLSAEAVTVKRTGPRALLLEKRN
ncbi:MAG: filamentous hemagglutinin family protein [Hyphomonadaceae bacterium]|nr:filamentous hemagglutinin family protein [Hyphomonadaceae bacterium]